MHDFLPRGIRYAVIASEGVDGIFYCWSRLKASTGDYEEEFKACKASDFWYIVNKESRYTEFPYSKYVKPRGYITVSLRSKELFRWGIFELAIRLPKYESGPLFWFGFELDDLFGGGVLHYMWDSERSLLKAFAGGFSSHLELDLTSYVPPDADRKRHLYRIIRREGLALWYIDDKLRAMAILCTGDLRYSNILYDKRPYTLGITMDIPSLALPVMLDIDGGDVDRDYEWPQLHPWYLRVSEGEPKAQLVLDLYIEDSEEKMNGLSTSEEVVSAPIPGTLDYKELLFAVKGNGIISLEGLVGNEWFVIEDYKVENGKLYNISINGKNMLYRVRFRPSSRTRIIVAQVVMQ